MNHGNIFKLHQIIKEYIFINHTPTIAQVTKIMSYFNTLSDPYESRRRKHCITFFGSIKKVIISLEVYNKVTIDFYHYIGVTYYMEDKLDKSLEAFNEIFSIKFKDMEIEILKKAEINLDLSEVYYKKYEYKNALKYCDETITVHEELNFNGNNERLGLAYLMMAKIQSALGNTKDTLIFHEKSMKIFNKMPENDSLVYLAKGKLILGDMKSSMKLYEEANDEYALALNDFQKLYPDGHIDTASTFESIGYTFNQLNIKIEAIIFLNKALTLKINLLSEDSNEIAYTYYLLAECYYKYKDCSLAKENIENALSIFNQKKYSPHSSFEDAKKLKKSILMQIKKYDNAIYKNKKRFCII